MEFSTSLKTYADEKTIEGDPAQTTPMTARVSQNGKVVSLYFGIGSKEKGQAEADSIKGLMEYRT